MTQRPLTADDLFPRGPLRRLGAHTLVFETLDSTSTYLLEHAVDLPDGTVVWAEYQSLGRGRWGRRWESPRGASILLSVLLHEAPESPIVAGAALLGALAAHDAVAQLGLSPLVRWPNDVIIEGRKVGGVLAETTGLESRGSSCAIVLGIGVNCWQQPGHFDADLRDKATSLDVASAHPVDRAAVVAALLECLDRWINVATHDEKGWEIARRTWRGRCGDFGTRVTLQHDGREFAGTAVDVSVEGDLIVQLDEGGRRHFAAATTTRVW